MLTLPSLPPETMKLCNKFTIIHSLTFSLKPRKENVRCRRIRERLSLSAAPLPDLLFFVSITNLMGWHVADILLPARIKQLKEKILIIR